MLQTIDFVALPSDLRLIDENIADITPVFYTFNYRAYTESEGKIELIRTDIMLNLWSTFDRWATGLFISFVTLFTFVQFWMRKMRGNDEKFRMMQTVWVMTKFIFKNHIQHILSIVAENLIWFWMLIFHVICFCSFCAGFSSSFVVPEFPFRVNTYQDLLDADYKPVCVARCGVEMAFVDHPNPVTRKVGHKLVQSGNCTIQSRNAILEIGSELHNRSAFLIGDGASNSLRGAYCAQFNRKLHITEESATTALMTFTMRNGLHPTVRSKFDRM